MFFFMREIQAYALKKNMGKRSGSFCTSSFFELKNKMTVFSKKIYT